MKKFLTLFFIIAIATVIACLYGILHHQLNYTISNEYYTRFKFIQFGLSDAVGDAILPNPRWSVATIGVLATWWMGIALGVIIGLAGLIHENWKIMLRISMKALLITLLVAFLTGLAGFAYGKFYLSHVGVDWLMPVELADQTSFIAVGSMHNFTYIGGLIGLAVGVLYSVRKKYSGKHV